MRTKNVLQSVLKQSVFLMVVMHIDNKSEHRGNIEESGDLMKDSSNIP